MLDINMYTVQFFWVNSYLLMGVVPFEGSMPSMIVFNTRSLVITLIRSVVVSIGACGRRVFFRTVLRRLKFCWWEKTTCTIQTQS